MQWTNKNNVYFNKQNLNAVNLLWVSNSTTLYFIIGVKDLSVKC